MDRLTAQQASFVKHFVENGGCATEAALAAGYSKANPAQVGWQQLQKASVQRAIQDEQRRVLGTLANKALRVLRTVLEDEAAPIRARVDAAKTVLDRAGLAAQRPMADATVQQDKSMAELSLDELAAIVTQAKASGMTAH